MKKYLLFTFYTIALILANWAAQWEMVNTPFLALDCGTAFSWLVALFADVACHLYGKKTAIVMSLAAFALNFVVALLLGNPIFIVAGSSAAFIISSIANAIIFSMIAKRLTFTKASFVSTFISQYADNFIFSVIVSRVLFGWGWGQMAICALTQGIVESGCELLSILILKKGGAKCVE